MDTKGIASTMYKLKSKNTTIVSGTHPRTLKQVVGSVLEVRGQIFLGEIVVFATNIITG